MDENITKIKTRYPFHGFYRPLLAEMEEIEAERAREQAAKPQLPELPTAAELPNTVPPAESVVIEPVPQQAIETAPAEKMTLPAPADTLAEPALADVAEGEQMPIAPEPSEAAPTITDSHPGKIEWVGDLIGDEFKQWGYELVAIHAMTFTGKTSFILGPLLDWCVETAYTVRPPMRILLLCNRKSLKLDILDEFNIKRENLKIIEHSTDEIECTIDAFHLVSIYTYQYWEQMLAKNPEWVMREWRNYRYIVLDEIQHVNDDAEFIENTDLLYDAILEAREFATVIAMTATPGNLFTTWLADGLLMRNRYYRLPKKMSHFTQAYVYSRDWEMINILQNLPVEEKALVFMESHEELERMKARFDDCAAYYCSSNNKKGKMDELDDCIKGGKLQKQILFATIALYNGINIKDRSLKHIFIESWVPGRMIQMQGRKRPVDVTDTCTVYYRSPQGKTGEEFEKKERRQLMSDLELVDAWRERERGNLDTWASLCRLDKTDEKIKHCKPLVIDYENMAFRINHRCEENYRQQVALIDEIRKRDYWLTAKRYVWDRTLDVKVLPYMNPNIEQFVREHVEVPIAKEELIDGLMRAGLFDPEEMDKAKRTQLNKWLRKYGAVIESSNRDKGREKGAKVMGTDKGWYSNTPWILRWLR